MKIIEQYFYLVESKAVAILLQVRIQLWTIHNTTEAVP